MTNILLVAAGLVVGVACGWLIRLKFEREAEFYDLPLSCRVIGSEFKALIASESEMVHGSTDILGDSWLKFRRVASLIKKSHPEVPTSDIFKAIILIYEEKQHFHDQNKR